MERRLFLTGIIKCGDDCCLVNKKSQLLDEFIKIKIKDF